MVIIITRPDNCPKTTNTPTHNKFFIRFFGVFFYHFSFFIFNEFLLYFINQDQHTSKT
uniref:Uncharacterized protein n=1 Tax=Octopus bimaculoides TaxID=37653 RepID=A0A0L8HTB1_OCTBM